ncbi:MAG: HlyD family efflux transporter periplasmic adaptor subunit [Pseudohongiellaceae bacterium]
MPDQCGFRFMLLSAALLLGACSDPGPRLALGTLERDRITLSATAAEIIISQPVAEGAEVQPGDLLVQLDPTLQQAVIAGIEADVARQQAVLERLYNGVRAEEKAAAAARVDTARAALQETEQDLARASTLVERGLGERAALETLGSRRASYIAQLRAVEAELQLLQAGTRSEEILEAEAQLQSIEARLAGERQRLQNLSVVATRAGTLDSLPWHQGQRVAVGQPVAVVLAEGPPHARVYIPEPARATITTGDSVVVHVDGVAEAFTGTVRWIALDPAFTPYFALNESERSRLVWLAEVQLPASAATLPAGLPAQIELP